jgi:hypothetical protein
MMMMMMTINTGCLEGGNDTFYSIKGAELLE